MGDYPYKLIHESELKPELKPTSYTHLLFAGNKEEVLISAVTTVDSILKIQVETVKL